MFQISDGRDKFYQWDANQRLICDGLAAGAEVHFANCVNCGCRCSERSDVALVMAAYEEDGTVYADVPNQLLQSGCKITVYAYVADGDEAHTAHMQTFKVMPRPKPDGYAATDTEVRTWVELDARITALEEDPGGSVAVDATLSQEGQAADAAAVGAAIATNTSDIAALAYAMGLFRSLPEVTTEDDGKFLRVVDGAWAAAAVPSAEDQSF